MESPWESPWERSCANSCRSLEPSSQWNVVVHFFGVEHEVDFFPGIVVVRTQHGIGRADQNRTHRAVADRVKADTGSAGYNLRAAFQRAVALEPDPDHDL